MLSWLRELLLGNWRNKGVAMFFAVTIWFVAYQSELQQRDIPIGVRLAPKQEDQLIILKQEPRGDGQMVQFSGVVDMKVNGSRKQIETLQAQLRGRVEVRVDASRDAGISTKRYFFNAEDMRLPRTPVEILSFNPESIDLVFGEKAESELPVTPVVPVREGMEKLTEIVEPSTIAVSGPKEILQQIRLVVEPPPFDPERGFDGTINVQARPERIGGIEVARVVNFLRGNTATLKVRFQLKQRELAWENVKVRFLVPALDFPFRVRFEESTVPLRFRGPEREIQRLEARLKEDPDFFVAVEVPQTDLLPGQERIFTFTEEKLLLFGFAKQIQKLQHESREGKGAWQCTIIPVPSPEETRP